MDSKFIHISDYTKGAFTDFDGSEVVITPSLVLFWKPPCPFGQWTDSPFEIDGISYNCAEQFMMAEKARLFGDVSIEKQILSTDSPRQQQKLGKRVSGFSKDQWFAERFDIVLRGNVAKFTQNEELQTHLFETGKRQLVEASPLDRIWGIGLAANDPEAYDPSSWNGLNLLGRVLEDVRGRLRNG